jgi:hypothetical protein
MHVWLLQIDEFLSTGTIAGVEGDAAGAVTAPKDEIAMAFL